MVLQWCEIRDADDEKTKSKKRKLLKSYKSKIRFQQMDMTQKKKQEDWQSFVKGKAKRKQVRIHSLFISLSFHLSTHTDQDRSRLLELQHEGFLGLTSDSHISLRLDF